MNRLSTETCVLLPTASFRERGGWVLDTQFTEVVGAPYLLAHGLGVPVLDATTELTLPAPGKWRVWVYTRNWVKWCDNPPGRFQLLINGTPLPTDFGIAPDQWAWVDGGWLDTPDSPLSIALRDLTGFDGRCAALAFSRENSPPDALPALMAEANNREEDSQRTVNYDLVVVGGGIAGTCTALAAARQGLSVALIHDRPMLGGNASQEVRVWCGGEARHALVREVRNKFMNGEPGAALCDNARMRLIQDTPNLALYCGWRLHSVGMTHSGGGIAAARAREMTSGTLQNFVAPLFVDATGDGWLGHHAGADYRMGREAASEFNESLAPERADKRTLGCSLMWSSIEANTAMPFGPLEWAESAAKGMTATRGEWNWEYGLDHDTILEAEEIRDYLLRVIYGSFSLAKREREHARRVLDFVPYNLGKRESRRLLGDHVLTENDVRERRAFPDAVASGTWSIDLHETTAELEYITTCSQPLFGRYWIPLRSLYSRNIENLMMVGRCFSATHVGLASPRVMNTTGQMGVAVGCAAALCRSKGVLPRQLVQESASIHELQELIGGAFPGHPDPVHSAWLIIDESDEEHVTVSGVWRKGLHENGDHYGEGYLYASRGGADTWVEYRPPITLAGQYRVRMIWNYYWDGRANAVPLIIQSAAGVSTVVVDMSRNSGEWSWIGEFELAPQVPFRLRVTTEGVTGIVVADAIALERVNCGS